MSSSSTSVTPASKLSRSSSSVPTDLTVSSSDTSASSITRQLQQTVRILQSEVQKRDARIAELQSEHDLKVAAMERSRNEAIETSVELRLAVHAKEMNKIQAAINGQLEQVIARQKYLETVNLKLKMNSEELKKRLETFRYDQNRYHELKTAQESDMNLEEYMELIIYKNIQIETRKSHESNLVQTQLQATVNKLNELLLNSEDQSAKLKEENERLILENKVNQKDLDDVREDVKKLDMLNVILKRKLHNQERVVTRPEKAGEVEVSLVNNDFVELQDTCRKLSERNEAGFSRLTFLSEDLQRRQMELLDQFSRQVRATKIDEKYKEEYLLTIKQLVTEHVRSQHYITQLLAEKDQLTKDIAQLTVKLKNLQMDLMEEEVGRSKEAEKVKYLEEKICKIEERQGQGQGRGDRETWKGGSSDVRETEDYQSVLSDLQLLIQHREEIANMKKIIKELQTEK